MLALIATIALSLGVDARLVQEVALAENPSLDPEAVGTTGDLGIMQINAQYLDYFLSLYWKSDWPPFDWKNPRDNVYLGVCVLKDLIENPYINTWQALIAYNCGLARLKSGNVPPASIEYATRIFINWTESGGEILKDDDPKQLLLFENNHQ